MLYRFTLASIATAALAFAWHIASDAPLFTLATLADVVCLCVLALAFSPSRDQREHDKAMQAANRYLKASRKARASRKA